MDDLVSTMGRARPHSTDPSAAESARSKATEIGATACAKSCTSIVPGRTAKKCTPAQPTPRRAARPGQANQCPRPAGADPANDQRVKQGDERPYQNLSLIHISEPTRLALI
eukprot:15204343-Alexandrium_andersonii.AAC.2